ncbi:MAG TPA: hypothetical protein VMC83_37250 [Streptosporangiaceae bacterium]|nr:hypothetical protein [Streptosporangiaceae bacterium]
MTGVIKERRAAGGTAPVVVRHTAGGAGAGRGASGPGVPAGIGGRGGPGVPAGIGGRGGPGVPRARPPWVPQAWLIGTLTVTLAAFATAIALAPPASAPPVRGLAWLLFVGSSVHVASTGWLYTLPEVRGYARQHRTRLVLVPAALILATALLAGALAPATMAWFLLPYYAWQFFHFQKQNLGMAALAASSRREVPLRPAERRALMTAGYAGIAGLVAHPGLLQLRLDPRLGLIYPAAAAVFAGAVAVGVITVARRPGGGAAFRAVYLTSLCFFGPVFVFGSPYAAVGGMTIAHGLQYLLLVGLVAAGNGQVPGRALRLAILCNVALAGGAVLSAASHLHGAAFAGRLAFGAYLGAVMAHFVIDASLWRLRDPFPRAFLASRVPGMLPPRVPAPDGSPADIR